MASSESRSDFQAAYSGVSNSLLRSRGFISSFQESIPISVEIGSREERRVRGARDLAQVAQQLHVGRQMAEIVVADQAAIRLAAELSEFLFVDLLEQRALVPGGVGILPQVPIELVLRDIHHANLEHRVGLGLEDQIVQTAPGALDLLELRRMQDFVHLRRKLLVQLRDHLLDRVEDIRLDDGGIGERLLDQGLDRVFDLRRRALGSRLEALLQQCRKLIGLAGFHRAASLPELELFQPPWHISPNLNCVLGTAFASPPVFEERSFNAGISCGSASNLRS